ncbi:MAG: FkbM family methyltransferase [Deltaproteobacteria bacterium]|nr:FkbM family methyltransferase [Deltaproteobacteria bacterium]MBT6433865.1 FkbM family methyltransferase [Deltaproteobacteria bacterium]
MSQVEGAVLSYAQNSEDVLLSRVLKDTSGIYVDVGACHPIIDSVTYAFYERGWTGINLEPTRAMFERLQSVRPRDINLNTAISSEDGHETFYECRKHLPLSTMNPTVAAEIRQSGGVLEERPIEVKTLATVLTEQNISRIDFLKVDVEGHEKEVLSGNDWGKFRPTVLVIESTHPRSTIGEYQLWEQIILKAGYVFAVFDGLNRYYVKQEESGLVEELSRPLSVFDEYVPFRQFAQIRFLRDAVARTLEDSEPVTGENLKTLLDAMVDDPMLCQKSPAFLGQTLKDIIAKS